MRQPRDGPLEVVRQERNLWVGLVAAAEDRRLSGWRTTSGWVPAGCLPDPFACLLLAAAWVPAAASLVPEWVPAGYLPGPFGYLLSL